MLKGGQGQVLGECALEPFGIDILGSQGKNAYAKRGHNVQMP